jgi:hypothetical protein
VYGLPGVAVFVGMSMLVAICTILLGPSTKGLALEIINHWLAYEQSFKLRQEGWVPPWLWISRRSDRDLVG